MASPVAVLEDYSLRSMTAADADAAAPATPERLQEFDNVVSRALPRFRRIAKRWLGNHEDAEDAVQDAMLSAFTHLADFEGRAQMSTWLTTVVTNAVLMQIRRRHRSQMLSLDRCPKEEESTTFAELLVDPKPTPDQTAEQRQLRKIVAHLAGGLPRSQQTALILRVQNGFSLKETAEILGVPLGTVKAQLARGRARIIERFHKITRTPKIEASGSGRKTRRKASSACRQNHTQHADYLPIPAVLSQGGGCELCVSV